MKNFNIIRSSQDLSGVIKQTRVEQGANQADVADMNGLSRWTLVDAESGKGDPKLSTVMRMMEALGLRVVVMPSIMAEKISAMDTYTSISGEKTQRHPEYLDDDNFGDMEIPHG